jgi:anti-sigma B factor antagonist
MSDTRPNAAPPAVPRGDNDDQITITVQADGPRSLIVVGGEVDMLTSPQLRATVLDQLGETAGVQLVVLDLNAVTFLGTSGLAVLIEVREAAHMAGVELRLACTARRVLRPLTIAGLVSLFDIRDSQEAALTAT